MMSKRPANCVAKWRMPAVPAVLAAALGWTLLAACSGPSGSAEDAVRGWVDQGVELAKEKNRRGLVRMISPDYTDGRGNDRDAIEDMFRFYFLRADDIGLLTRIEDVTVHGDTAAELLLSVAMAGTTDGVLGFSADAYRFEMELEREGDDWLLIGARWAELGEELK